MKNWMPKFMSIEDCEVIDKMCADGHKDTLVRFGRECIAAYEGSKATGLKKGALIGSAICTGIVIGGALLEHYHKKKAEEPEEEKKPEHDFLMV